jgi:hypothetical protein
MTMKKINYLSALLCAAALSACVSTDSAVQDITAAPPGSRVRFFNFGVCGTSSTTTTSCMPGVNFYANDTKMSAISSATGTEAVTGIAYSGASASGLYSGINPGTYTFSGKIAAATDKDLAVSSLQSQLADGKLYSVYLSGFYDPTTKKVDSFIVDDALPAVDYNNASVRLVNAISNSSAMVLYAKNTVTGVETAIGGSIAYKAAGAFVAVPGAAYDLSMRAPGSSTNLFTRAAVSFVAGRIYTVTTRGDMTITSTTAINRPSLDNTANY